MPHQPVSTDIPVGTPSDYARVHRDARKVMPTKCEHCGTDGSLHAALRPDAPVERLLVNPKSGCRYTESVKDYQALCPPCHYQQDFGQTLYCRKGHAYTPENTAPGKDGTRRCRECNRTSKKQVAGTPKPPPTEEQRERQREHFRKWAAKPGVREARTASGRARRAAQRAAAGR